MPKTMQAIRVYQYGGPEELKLEEIPRPEPQPGELLVRIHAAGVLPADGNVRAGWMRGVLPKAFPYTPGTAFSGVIEAVGADVDDYVVGQAICGRAPNGTYAEYVTIMANPPALQPGLTGLNQSASIIPLAPKPTNLSFDEAATLSGGATTAWMALMEDAGLQSGQRVLIHGAAGGVGLFAVQFAKWKGAYVIGTASTGNLDFLRSLGVDTVIDYTTTPFENIVNESGLVDVVLDTVGGETQRRSLPLVKKGGTLVSIVEPPEIAEELGIRSVKNFTMPTNTHLRQIVQLVEAGHVKPTIQKIFPLAEAADAQRLCATGHGRGRIVLHIAD